MNRSFNSKLSIGKSKNNSTILKVLKDKEFEGVIAAAITYNQVANLNAVALRTRILEIID